MFYLFICRALATIPALLNQAVRWYWFNQQTSNLTSARLPYQAGSYGLMNNAA